MIQGPGGIQFFCCVVLVEQHTYLDKRHFGLAIQDIDVVRDRRYQDYEFFCLKLFLVSQTMIAAE